MNNTIHNVPRELLERVTKYCLSAPDAIKARNEVRTLLSAPSPTGVDGLSVVAVVSSDDGTTAGYGYLVQAAPDGEELCRLSDAQAIIDGLRGEVERSKQFAAGHVLTNERISESLHAVEDERDQQAQRIGELEGLLRHAQKQVPTGSGLHMRIDAALASIGKEAR